MKNTKEYATIHIVNSQTSEGITKSTEFEADCEFYEKDGSFHIVYKEDADIGTEEARVFLKIQKDGVTMRRMGKFKTVMAYKEGEVTDTLYSTPFGSMSMKISTSRIENKLSQNGGSLQIGYTLIIGDENIENDIRLKIKKEKNYD